MNDVRPAKEPTRKPAPEATPAPAEPVDNRVIYVSAATDEPHSFTVMGQRGERDAVTNRLFWRVAPEDEERFAAHHHVTNGRIIKKA